MNLKEAERKRRDLEKIQIALSSSKDHENEQGSIARLRARLVEMK